MDLKVPRIDQPADVGAPGGPADRDAPDRSAAVRRRRSGGVPRRAPAVAALRRRRRRRSPPGRAAWLRLPPDTRVAMWPSGSPLPVAGGWPPRSPPASSSPIAASTSRPSSWPRCEPPSPLKRAAAPRGRTRSWPASRSASARCRRPARAVWRGLDAVHAGELDFLTHAQVVPARDLEEAARFDARAEAVAVQVTAAYEQHVGACVRDVSHPDAAWRAGLPDRPGFDCSPTAPAVNADAATNRSTPSPEVLSSTPRSTV